MKHGRPDVGRFLRRYAQFLEELSEADLEALIDGRARLALVREGEERPQPAHRRPYDGEFVALIERLRATESREEALRILSDDPRVAGKDGIVRLARALKLHINRHDKRETVEDRVVESVIGVRLRSEAIQGLSLKGGSPQRPTEAPPAEDAGVAKVGSDSNTTNGNDRT